MRELTQNNRELQQQVAYLSQQLEAIKKVGKKDRDAIREAVLATKDFDKGAVGKWSFTPDGTLGLKSGWAINADGSQKSPEGGGWNLVALLDELDLRRAESVTVPGAGGLSGAGHIGRSRRAVLHRAARGGDRPGRTPAGRGT